MPSRINVDRVIWAAILAVLLATIATMTRRPTTEPDAQLYASITKGWLVNGNGVPTVTENSPLAADHIGFYGPVYFGLTSATMRLLGISKFSVRLVSLAGVLLIVAAGVTLAVALSGWTGGWQWSILLILLAPEAQMEATSGGMGPVAIGLALSGLALLVLTIKGVRRSTLTANGAGLCLALSALTTPRSYPLIAAIFCAGVFRAYASRPGRRALFIAAAWVVGAVALWAQIYMGGVPDWFHLIWRVATNEDSDVAVVGTRDWAFTPLRVVTPLVDVALVFVAAWMLDRWRRRHAHHVAAEFALLATAIGFAAYLVVMDLTFLVGLYIAIPLFTVLLALPWSELGASPRSVRLARVLVLAGFLGSLAVTYSRVAATWDARDPERIVAFLRANVPSGSSVVGPNTRFFFAVERAGGSYFSVYPDSFADWTRWEIPAGPTSSPAGESPSSRFLLWPTAWTFPEGYACAADHAVATYHPPPPNLPIVLSVLRGYDLGNPESTLYALPAGCPAGYDASRPH